MQRDRRKSLAVISGVSAQRTAGGRYELPQKFLDGMEAYAKAWDGEVCAYFHEGSVDLGNLDRIEVAAQGLGFDVRVLHFDSPEFWQEIEGRGIVLGVHYLLPDLAQRCLDLAVPCVYNMEYTLRTRLQIISAESKNPLRRLRRRVWELNEESRLIREIRTADGVQCNGLPSYLKYGPLNRSPLLYFDSRVRAEDLISDGELMASNGRRRSKRPLHLVFSGRLIPAKGADQLISVATALRRRGVPFRFTICGDGELRPRLIQRVKRADLQDIVDFPGVLDFSRELLPFIKREADLFVCCHPQGDPSCTYLETFACGVPIVGYANEALLTLLEHCEAGATVAVQRPDALAALIQELATSRDRLALWAHRARNFAAEHVMETTFARRIAHLLTVRDDFLRRGRRIMPRRSSLPLRAEDLKALHPA